RGTHELRMLLLFGAAILAAVLVSSSVPPGGPPQWVVLSHHSTSPTYFIIPIMCLYAACVWMIAQRTVAWRAAGALVLGLALAFAIPNDWREAAIDDSDFPASVRTYE